MKEIRGCYLTGERALFGQRDIEVYDTVFGEGESPLKECAGVRLQGCTFGWKYPLWYGRDIRVQDCMWTDTARAGVWYTDDIELTRCRIAAPKNFRRCRGLVLRDVSFADAAETLWSCDGVHAENVTARGDYFAMHSQNLVFRDFTLYGNYGFDSVRNVQIANARMMTKDAFWNSENVTVTDSYIGGEYLGWNSKNLTFINCTLESLQGLCYIENLVLKNCKLLHTSLAFEYSTVDAEISGGVDSVKNPSGGRIRADRIGELILQKEYIDPARTEIVCPEVGKRVLE